MKHISLFLVAAFATFAAAAQEIGLQMILQNREYVVGEPLLVAFDFLNATRTAISCGKVGAPDRFFVEITKNSDQFELLEPFNEEPIGGDAV